MRRTEVQCPWCGAWYRRIEVDSMKGEPGEYDCLLCNQPLESFSGETYVAYRLVVQP
jgi:DNA-directed RNA polymerase subunit RPC12/RpoP